MACHDQIPMALELYKPQRSAGPTTRAFFVDIPALATRRGEEHGQHWWVPAVAARTFLFFFFVGPWLPSIGKP